MLLMAACVSVSRSIQPLLLRTYPKHLPKSRICPLYSFCQNKLHKSTTPSSFCTSSFSPTLSQSPVMASLEPRKRSMTKLEYFEDMQKLQSKASLLSYIQGDDGRNALILDSTIFHPQGGGQPYDTGYISNTQSDSKFIVQDVRSKDGLVYHYGHFENPSGECDWKLEEGLPVLLFVDEERRKLNSRLHSAGHLLDICMQNVGLDYLEPGKGYHFPDGPFVEYKGIISQSELQTKQKELELEANTLISKGGMVIAAVLTYEEASELCGGTLPDYISKESSPRIVRYGNYPGCPCGGTHVADISEIKNLKVSQIRTKKGLTKVFYRVDI